jgi:hypothetical protein
VAGAADPLALRVHQSDVSWPQVRRLVTDLVAASDRLHQLCSDPLNAGPELAALEVARPPLRTDDPRHELADRLARLHRGAWELAHTRDVGVASMQDYAPLGVILHGHAAALLRTQASTERDRIPDNSPSSRVIDRVQQELPHGRRPTSGSDNSAPRPRAASRCVAT